MRTFLALLLSLFAGAALAATPEEDVQRYLAVFSDTLADTDKAVEELGWKGISDPRLYDVIEERLLVEAPKVGRSKIDRNRIGHYIRGLGFSGQEKYARTISSFLDEKGWGRHARTSLEDLKLYARWNPIISSRDTFDPQYSDDVNRVRNMLRSDDRMLQKLGAKCVYHRHANETVLLDLLAGQLLASYKTASDPESMDAVAWMVKGIGKSANSKYVPVLQEVSRSGDGKVSREASGWLRRM
jgi:hypothetical protein